MDLHDEVFVKDLDFQGEEGADFLGFLEAGEGFGLVEGEGAGPGLDLVFFVLFSVEKSGCDLEENVQGFNRKQRPYRLGIISNWTDRN